ncbi:MAG: bacteriophage abortive infection AbiH family protein, partial [Lachnospiraceae bacterium]|nr:bacteriophage abortive infection AbiH family protein [Lachnospiraceae bacterium]
MKILLIGNGFDLAHQLPTKYTDFLEFVKVIKQVVNINKPHDTNIDWDDL